ncbi:beta-lactamase [Polymorphobacter glacialis]|uniref:Beta-lactamase n=1 Tax=Sandarakinorhabdus glacialis TaxID=1614636 RepID=A0A916ZP25_9SPHN|nr:class A beta-lactamase [Polymorphobacter glacialis]GGE05089.1 beta-lactamase [Polymorphobacter glacialis]
MIDRRQFAQIAALLTAAPALARTPAPLDLKSAVLAAEKSTGGRIGLAVHDTASGRCFSHRGAELFPMASTFKALLAAAILQRVDQGKDSLSRTIAVRKADIVSNSPVSEKHIGGTATVAQLTEATVIYSDNTAANLLLPALGGPAGFTRWLRDIGDPVTRLDRFETMMSEALPGDPRDTTSPDAVIATWQRLLLGNILKPASRAQLTDWLIANTTGDTRLRAGLPKGWKVGDKTGTGGHGSVNDVAIVWPVRADPRPLFIASFVNGGTAPSETFYKAHAHLARAIAAAI